MAETVALRPRVAAEGGFLRRLLSGRNVIVLVVIAIVGYLGAVPLGFLLWQTFIRNGALTLANLNGTTSSTPNRIMIRPTITCEACNPTSE